MSPEPPIEHSIEVKQEESDASANDALSIDEDGFRSKVKFSGLRWASTGSFVFSTVAGLVLPLIFSLKILPGNV